MRTCYVCDQQIAEGEPHNEVINARTGNVWLTHAECDGSRVPVPDSYAATARMMAEIFGSADVDWDEWKDQMKEEDF